MSAIDFLVGAQVSTDLALTACSLGRAVEEGLTYKFHAAWSSVLQLLCVFFQACGRQAHPVMKKVSWGAAGTRTRGGDWAVGLWAPREVLCLVPLHFTPLYTPDGAHSRCLVLCLQEGDRANMGETEG